MKGLKKGTNREWVYVRERWEGKGKRLTDGYNILQLFTANLKPGMEKNS
jgi:hypothetical protein